MKPWMLPVAALVLGVAGGTGASWMTKKASPAASESAHAPADSAHAAPATSEAPPHEAAPPTALAASLAETAPAVMAEPSDSAAASQPRPDSVPSHGAVEADVDGTPTDSMAAPISARTVEPDDTTTLRLARIFGAMRPEDAARLLEPLDDASLRRILLALSDRKAAAILAKFKGERSVTLARALTNDGAH